MRDMYKEIVQQSLGKGSEEVMHKSVELVDELLMEIKHEHPQRYWRFIREQQGLVSGGHYDEAFARYDVEQMWHTDKRGEKHCGEHWSVSQARQVMREHGLASPVNEYDVYVALNAFWHDLSCVIEEESVIVEAAVAFWFKDEDFGDKSKVWWYFCNREK